MLLYNNILSKSRVIEIIFLFFYMSLGTKYHSECTSKYHPHPLLPKLCQNWPKMPKMLNQRRTVQQLIFQKRLTLGKSFFFQSWSASKNRRQFAFQTKMANASYICYCLCKRRISNQIRYSDNTANYRPATNISKTGYFWKKFQYSKLISVKKYASACISKEKGELFFRSNMT